MKAILFHAEKGDFSPAFFDANGNFYVRASYHGVEALFLYDLKTAHHQGHAAGRYAGL